MVGVFDCLRVHAVPAGTALGQDAPEVGLLERACEGGARTAIRRRSRAGGQRS
jgi:hypothetical protein